MISLNKYADIITELVALILDYLPIPELLRFARVSKRYHEMVYDETRWIRRLILMECWDEAEARKRSEEAARRRLQALSPKRGQGGRNRVRLSGAINGTTAGKGGPGRPTSGLVSTEHGKSRQEKPRAHAEGEWLEVTTGRHGPEAASASDSTTSAADQLSAAEVHALRILSTIRSIRSLARQEYGRVYQILAPIYFNIADSTSHTDALIFQTYQSPEDQAQMLAQIRSFANSDVTVGGQERREKLMGTIRIFETAALREFE